MNIGIIRYPGSNCDYDTLRYFPNSFFIWHKESKLPHKLDFLIIPGGFAFGDRLYNNATGKYTISPGSMAIQSPVSNIIIEASKKNIPILGICNGFQILVKMGLLPGELINNNNKKFTCKKVKCLFNSTYNIHLYVANSYGRYKISDEQYNVMEQNNQIFLKYTEDVSEIGSDYNIAGVCNDKHNIFGMMPHPERNNINIIDLLYQLIFPDNKILQNQIQFNRKISDLMNCEHISYKSTRKFLKNLHTQESWVIQGPGENAGIVDIGQGYAIALRIESHNHPTFINPFQGAATGVGGILRDIFTMGAKPIALLDFLRFGTNEHSNNLLHKSVDGISYYGNCIGVPIVGGELRFHNSYNNNPLINIGCIGIVKKDNIIYGRATDTEQLLIYVGSKTGNEGIGGATMASNNFDNNTENLQENIQKADPFLEKLLLDACCEIAENKLVIGMQDMGAGGILCASIEVLKRGYEYNGLNLGCNLYLDKVPTKHNMSPCDILISESQERMFIIASKNNKDKIFEIFEKWDLEASVIGETNLSGEYNIFYHNDKLYSKKISNFKNIYQHWDKSSNYNQTNNNQSNILPKNNNKYSYLWKQYDSTVGNRTIKGPDMPNPYSLLDIYEINKVLAITWAENVSICLNNMINLKAKPLAIVNCLNYGNPAQNIHLLENDVDNMNSICKQYNIPIIGGNVSLYNTTNDISIRPTPIIMMIGII